MRKTSIALAAALAVFASQSVSAADSSNPVTWEQIANDHASTKDVLTYGMGLKAQRLQHAGIEAQGKAGGPVVVHPRLRRTGAVHLAPAARAVR